MTKSILHIDGDAFFASCEQSRNPALKGKLVITGKERGIASSMSYEAKQRGITRGMRLFEIRQLCPDAVILASDYEFYSMMSQRFVSIVRRYTSAVEEYSIDECFADLTGMDKPLNMSYEDIARRIQREVATELGCTFSVGLAPTKVLAKVASKWMKPNGFTIIEEHTIPKYLENLPIESVWGIGRQTAGLLQRYGIFTALQFVNTPPGWVREKLTKPFIEIWQELHGTPVYTVESDVQKPRGSIQKVKTFTPPSDNREYIFSQLSRNVEDACIRARRHGFAAKEITFFLRTQDFRHFGIRVQFDQATAFPNKIIHSLEEVFGEVFHSRNLYRATGVVFSKLTTDASSQLDLFGEHLQVEKMARLFEGVDALDEKYGKHTVFVGASAQAQTLPQNVGERSESPWQEVHKLLNIPFWSPELAH